ncbi:MAG TPA: lactate racemase domain-containing protein [Ktedonobacterales bacterium]|nr:lactate racemase domain-containing protein [Ktedonobacterales bacterium]
MIVGDGATGRELGREDVRALLAQAFEGEHLNGKRVLAIIPDGTRSAPIPLLFELLYEVLGRRVRRLDYLIALGTHPPLSPDAIDRLVGVPAAERAERYAGVRIFNHQWDRPEALVTVAVITRTVTDALTGGLLAEDVPVTLNRLILDYDRILICGPVFPHEVAGFSGGAKYLFPGIAGPDIINFTHWLGALVTSMGTIGVKDTPVRRIIHRAAGLVPREIDCIALVMRGDILRGMYVGRHVEAFEAAAELSARLNIIYLPHPFQQVLSMPATRYDDLWTAAKAMYKTEPVVAAGGEVIIYAPHLTEVSYTHGALIDRIGYHVRDYFLAQWERFRDIPGGVLAHSTHVKGAGSYDAASGIEAPRIQVTLATGIPEERCRRINLGYRDYREIDPAAWEGREDEGKLLVPHAGEMLYRLA